MPTKKTEGSEICTGLGMLAPDLASALRERPAQLLNVSDETWGDLHESWQDRQLRDLFENAFANGQAFLHSASGLRSRVPSRVEWKGPHREQGDDIIPADLRIDHVYLVSCKYLSKVLLNAAPRRLFENLLRDDSGRSPHWFLECGPGELQDFYRAFVDHYQLSSLPANVEDLTRAQQRQLKGAVPGRKLPAELEPTWSAVCGQVSTESARRWNQAAATDRDRLRLLWKMLRIASSTYYILGSTAQRQHQFMVLSAWDWSRDYELSRLSLTPDLAGQPKVDWRADVQAKSGPGRYQIDGHIEIRWSHGRFVGNPEAKVYVDTPLPQIPGYEPLNGAAPTAEAVPEGQLFS